MYTLEDLREGVRRPWRTLVELYSLLRRYSVGVDGVNVLEEDWDNLIILDACRYDVFAELNTVDGDLKPVRSIGSQTGEFLEKTFGGRTLPDTVYVFAKPNPIEVGAQLHDVVNVWRDAWDPAIDMVPNEAMVDRALAVNEEFPNKRLVIHFVPPHLPFIGEYGRQLHEEHDADTAELWDLAKSGVVSRDEMWRAYRENLKVTLPHVDRLQSKLQGKTVVTSDHGQAFGELGVYNHPPGVYIDSLLRVPWLEIETDDRKEITAGSATKDLMDYTPDDVKDQLHALGYTQ